MGLGPLKYCMESKPDIPLDAQDNARLINDIQSVHRISSPIADLPKYFI